MTAPRICEYCGAALDAGEQCDCGGAERAEHNVMKLSWRRPRETYEIPGRPRCTEHEIAVGYKTS